MKLHRVGFLIPRKKHFAIVFLAFLLGLTLWFALQTDTHTPAITDEAFFIDSVFSTLNTHQKIGLILCANYANMTSAASMPSCINDTILCLNRIVDEQSIKCFSQGSYCNNLLTTTYFIWKDSPANEYFLPPVHSFNLLQLTDTLSYFAEKFASLLYTHQLHGLIIPASTLFDSTSLKDPAMFNALMLSLEPSYFYLPFISILYDSPVPEKNEQAFRFITARLRLSSVSTHHKTFQYGEISMVLDSLYSFDEFLHSPYHIYASNPAHVSRLLADASQRYEASEEIRALIDRKARHVLYHKMKASKQLEKYIPGETLMQGSTAHSTIMLRWAELTSAIVNINPNTIPLLLPDVNFILSKTLHIPVFYDLIKEICPECKINYCTDDSMELERIVMRAPVTSTFVFIGNQPQEFKLTEKAIHRLQTAHTVFVQFARKPCRIDTAVFQTYAYFPDISEFYQIAAVNFLIGAENIHGNLPGMHCSAKTKYQFERIRLKYSFPEDAELDGTYLNRTIDSICTWAIEQQVFPGCQIFAARNGKIIFHKAYGYHTYDKKQPVRKNDLYDIASITKIAATTLAFMKLYEQGKIALDDQMHQFFKNKTIRFSKIIPDTIIVVDTFNLRLMDLQKIIQENKITGDTFRLHDTLLVMTDTIIRTATPKLNIFLVPFRYMLLHCSGIVPSLPILPFVQKDKFFSTFTHISHEQERHNSDIMKSVLYTQHYSDSSTIQIAEGLYLKNRWRDTLWEMTKALGVSKRRIRQYSDINMILLQITIDTILKKNFAAFLNKEFYRPLGMYNTYFNPLSHKILRERIPPTEHDQHWRQQIIQGYVHDPSAALLGGIAGNAGLFSCAQDLGILFQMLLNGGTYGGKRYLKKETVQTFTKTYEESDRGLGFDKYSPRNIIAPSASVHSYGHTGFTGCCVWVDPEAQIVFVFLSNRTFPDASNWKINTYKIRQSIHEAFYEAMRKYTQSTK